METSNTLTDESTKSDSATSSLAVGSAAEVPKLPPVAEPAVTPPPETTPQALDYIRTAVAQLDLRTLMLEDQLVTVSDTGKELGEFNVDMEFIRRHGDPCFLVHANSQGMVDGVPCGTSIVCYVSMALETLEQHHHEFMERDPLDRKTVILKSRTEYNVNKIVTRGTEMKTTSRTFSFDQMKGFISEGSNLLLHRLFIWHGLPEELQFVSFDSDDNLCPSVYRSLAERQQKVEDTEIRVLGVERTIDSKVDLPITWQSYYTEKGFLANRVQVGSPVTMTLQQMPVEKDRDRRDPKPMFGKKELIWEDDLQMYSAFLDRKEELKNSHEVFVRHHPEMRALLADYLQFLLLCKPHDVLAFSADYFAAFSKGLVSAPQYLTSAVPTLFPHCRTNAKIEELTRFRPETE